MRTTYVKFVRPETLVGHSTLGFKKKTRVRPRFGALRFQKKKNTIKMVSSGREPLQATRFRTYRR